MKKKNRSLRYDIRCDVGLDMDTNIKRVNMKI